MAQQVVRGWMAISGALMVVMGVLAVIDTSIAGSGPRAVLAMNAMHGGVHALGGLVAIAIGVALHGQTRANATIAFGILFLIGFAVNAVSLDLWGMMSVPANGAVHVMHLTAGLLGVGTGYLARWDRVAYRAATPTPR